MATVEFSYEQGEFSGDLDKISAKVDIYKKARDEAVKSYGEGNFVCTVEVVGRAIVDMNGERGGDLEKAVKTFIKIAGRPQLSDDRGWDLIERATKEE